MCQTLTFKVYYSLTYHYILYLCCSNPVAAHVNDVIKAPCDLVVSLRRAIGTITGKEVTYSVVRNIVFINM